MSGSGTDLVGPVVLVGFMAAGKSTVGPLLAERLGWDFIDLDAAIAERTGRSPGQLIRESGEAEFRRFEADVTRDLAGRTRLVLAPGGGWVTRPELAELLGPQAVRVWLRLGADEVLRRVARDEIDRPLLDVAEGRSERVNTLLREREPYYQAADFEVNVDTMSPDQVVDEILRRLGRDPGEE